MDDWFKRLADVPNVNYHGKASRNAIALQVRPKLYSHNFDGKQHVVLMWPTENGESSSSPAASHAAELFKLGPKISMDEHLKRLEEVLDLPGTLSDYHFAIQHCIEQLWKGRRQNPAHLPEIERLCWLDIRLVEAHPETITYERNGENSFYRVLAFDCLVQLYEREGFVQEALAVAQRSVRFGIQTDLAKILERVASVDAEQP